MSLDHKQEARLVAGLLAECQLLRPSCKSINDLDCCDCSVPPAGFTAVHWFEVGDTRAVDTTILDWARANGHVLVTHNLDFGALLVLISALNQTDDALADGAWVTVSPSESRVRILPLRRG